MISIRVREGKWEVRRGPHTIKTRPMPKEPKTLADEIRLLAEGAGWAFTQLEKDGFPAGTYTVRALCQHSRMMHTLNGVERSMLTETAIKAWRVATHGFKSVRAEVGL